MKTWCKIIEYPETQLLVSKDQDGDGDPVISLSAHFECGHVAMGMGYMQEEKRDEEFDKFTQEKCDEAYLVLRNLHDEGFGYQRN